MLLRYSRHLAAGHGVVWNVGEPPVDGATDFLFMVVVALLHRFGLSLEAAARAWASSPTPRLSSSSTFALDAAWTSPPRSPSCLRFSSPWARGSTTSRPLRHTALCPSRGRRLVGGHRGGPSPEERLPPAALRLAFASLLLGLARPEGVFLGVFFLLAVIVYRHGEGTKALVSRFLLVFLTLGLAYFLWRWYYFGHPLPNPFYRKGGGVLHPHSLRMAWRNLWELSLPFVVAARRGAPRALDPPARGLHPAARGRLRQPVGPHLRRDQLRHALPLPDPARGPRRVRGSRGTTGSAPGLSPDPGPGLGGA